jgi:hypothetical protein
MKPVTITMKGITNGTHTIIMRDRVYHGVFRC